MFCVCFQGTSTNFGIFIWMEKTTPRRRIHCCCTPNCWRWTNTLADARCIFVSSSGLSIVLFLNWANDIFYTLNLTLTETCLHFYMLEHYFGVFINHFSVNHWLVADLKFCYLCRDICTHTRTQCWRCFDWVTWDKSSLVELLLSWLCPVTPCVQIKPPGQIYDISTVTASRAADLYSSLPCLFSLSLSLRWERQQKHCTVYAFILMLFYYTQHLLPLETTWVRPLALFPVTQTSIKQKMNATNALRKMCNTFVFIRLFQFF